jgi:prepilin peptidase CpaA
MTGLLALSLFPAGMVCSAVMDLFTMTISNRIALALVAGFFVLAALAGLPATAVAMHVGVGLAMLVVAFVLFAQGWIGGGDAKLFAATALWLGWSPHLFQYMLAASLLGGMLTVALLSIRKLPLPLCLARQEWIGRLHAPTSGVPYGIALAGAGLLVYPDTFWMASLGA